jgi:HJR/Mrr/RecB family endonuclease
MIFTNSYFTKSAIELAKINNVELINRDKLKQLIDKHYL